MSLCEEVPHSWVERKRNSTAKNNWYIARPHRLKHYGVLTQPSPDWPRVYTPTQIKDYKGRGITEVCGSGSSAAVDGIKMLWSEWEKRAWRECGEIDVFSICSICQEISKADSSTEANLSFLQLWNGWEMLSVMYRADGWLASEDISLPTISSHSFLPISSASCLIFQFATFSH